MRVGFIGAGRMAQRRLMNLPEGCEPVAVYTHNISRVVDQKAHDTLERLRVRTPEEVCEQSDLVIVATHHRWLAEYAALAQEQGAQAFIEKPGGISSAELEELEPCRVGYNHRFWPGIQAAKNAISGPILHIRATYGHGNADREWRMKPELSGGGELLDQGSHLIDLCRFFTGKDVELIHSSLWTEYWDTPVEDSAFLLLGLAPGTAQLHASWCEWAPVFRFEIVTLNEKIVVEGLPWERQMIDITPREGEPAFDQKGPVSVVSIKPAWTRDPSLRLELEDLLDKGPTGATTEDAAAVLRIVEEAYA